MNVELMGSNKNFVSYIPEKQKGRLSKAVGNEMSKLGNDTVNALGKAKTTLVVDVLDIKPKGMVVDARLFNDSNMPISGKTCLMEITKLKEFTDPKILAEHFSSLVQKLADNAKMLK